MINETATYVHRCGAREATVAAAFVHLLACPLEEPRAARDLSRFVGNLATRPRSAHLEGAGLDDLSAVVRKLA